MRFVYPQLSFDFIENVIAYAISVLSPWVTQTIEEYSPMYVVPSIRTKMASRAFSHAAPTIWNNLPHDVRETTSINSFRIRLKTFYFKSAY